MLRAARVLLMPSKTPGRIPNSARHPVRKRRFPADAPVMKRAERGLYAGRHIVFGNKVSWSQRKSRRSWKPNVHWKNFWSESLQKFVRVRATTRAMRTIDKYGGLDRYLTECKPRKLGVGLALELRKQVLEAQRQAATDTGPAASLNAATDTPAASGGEASVTQ